MRWSILAHFLKIIWIQQLLFNVKYKLGLHFMRWNSVSNKPSPISISQMSDVLPEAKWSLSFVAAFRVHLFESFEDVWGEEEFYIYRAGEFNPIFMTDWQEESYQCLRWSDLSNNPSRKLFILYYLSAHLFLIVRIKVSTDQRYSTDTAANCK